MFDYVPHMFVYVYTYYTTMAGHGPKYGSRYGCLIIAYTKQQGNKGVNNAARHTKGGLAEARGLSS